MTPEELQQWQLRDRFASNLQQHGVPATANETLAQLVGKVSLIGATPPPLKLLGLFDYTLDVACTNIGTATGTGRQNILNNTAGTFSFTTTFINPAITATQMSNYDFDLSRVRRFEIIGLKSMERTLSVASTAASSPVLQEGWVKFTNLSLLADNVPIDLIRGIGALNRMAFTYATVSRDNIKEGSCIRFESNRFYVAVNAATAAWWNTTNTTAACIFIGAAYGE